MEEPRKARRWVPVMLVVLPLWLVASAAVAVWLGLRANQEREREEQALHAKQVDAASLADDVRKLVEVVGRRDTTDETGWRGLERAAAMCEGALGAGNAGYQVRKLAGPDLGGRSWPMLEVATGGSGKPGVWVVAAYDTRGGGVEANSTGLAAVLAAARALAGAELRKEVRFVLLPHGFEVDGPVLQGSAALLERIRAQGGASQLLCVESMGASPELWISSRDTEAPVFEAMDGLGVGKGAEDVCLADDFDLASTLFEMGLPAARVATRGMVGAAEEDAKLPEPGVLAGSAGRLVELVRRLAK